MPAHVVYTTAMDKITPVIAAQVRSAELVNDGARTVAVTHRGDIIRVKAFTDVYCAIGDNLTASPSNAYFLSAGETAEFGQVQNGWTVSIQAV
ncbi:MAG: hypothetical protein U5K75_12180 [Ahrensia sp.]|nr:hypothetical protein [Ahrensia sp.]